MNVPILFSRHSDAAEVGTSLLDGNDPGNTLPDPWDGQPKYALAMALVCTGLIALAGLVSLISRGNRALRLSPSMVAFFRYFAYKPTSIRRRGTRLSRTSNIRLPALGVTIFISLFMAAFSIWALIIKPYYRTDITYGSPPLSLRAASLAVGLIPFVYALGSKVNFIGLLTNSSHDKLQVYHQWASRFVLLLATIHVIPFIYQNLREGGMAGLKEYYYADDMNITGTVSYALLFFLVFSSFRGLRNWCYELWVATHVLAALFFMAFLFIHTGGELTSWRYLWGAAALYGLSVYVRLARQLHSSVYFMISYATIEALPGSATRMTISTNARWKVGQHMFIRFPTIELWSSHPFTIISLPSAQLHSSPSNIVLTAKASGGLTKKLHSYARSNSALLSTQNEIEEDGEEKSLATGMEMASCTVPAILDGPYGCDASVASEKEILFIAGGSGITFVTASIVDLAWQTEMGNASPSRVKLMWYIREQECVEWVRAQLDTALEILGSAIFEVDIYLTRSSSEETLTQDGSSLETSYKDIGSEKRWSIHSVGPNPHPTIDQTIRDFVQTSKTSVDELPRPEELNRAIAIVACGPHTLMQEVKETSAEMQWDIVKGRAKSVRQVRLIAEEFGW